MVTSNKQIRMSKNLSLSPSNYFIPANLLKAFDDLLQDDNNIFL